MNANEKAKRIWKRIFSHPECLFDVFFKDGSKDFNVQLEDWHRKSYGKPGVYKEEGDYPRHKLPPNRVIIKIVFHCSNCERRKACEKYEKQSGIRMED